MRILSLSKMLFNSSKSTLGRLIHFASRRESQCSCMALFSTPEGFPSIPKKFTFFDLCPSRLSRTFQYQRLGSGTCRKQPSQRSTPRTEGTHHFQISNFHWESECESQMLYSSSPITLLSWFLHVLSFPDHSTKVHLQDTHTLIQPSVQYSLHCTYHIGNHFICCIHAPSLQSCLISL